MAENLLESLKEVVLHVSRTALEKSEAQLKLYGISWAEVEEDTYHEPSPTEKQLRVRFTLPQGISEDNLQDILAGRTLEVGV